MRTALPVDNTVAGRVDMPAFSALVVGTERMGLLLPEDRLAARLGLMDTPERLARLPFLVEAVLCQLGPEMLWLQRYADMLELALHDKKSQCADTTHCTGLIPA